MLESLGTKTETHRNLYESIVNKLYVEKGKFYSVEYPHSSHKFLLEKNIVNTLLKNAHFYEGELLVRLQGNRDFEILDGTYRTNVLNMAGIWEFEDYFGNEKSFRDLYNESNEEKLSRLFKELKGWKIIIRNTDEEKQETVSDWYWHKVSEVNLFPNLNLNEKELETTLFQK